MVRPKKYLGQHFLHDDNIARKIISFLPPQPELVLEIGPGRGILTKYLLQEPRHDPYFLEIDPEAVDFLSREYPDIVSRLIHADFLDFDLNNFPPEDLPRPSSLVLRPSSLVPRPSSLVPRPSSLTLIGNFPYNISSQILFRALDHRHRITTIIGMFQKEVAERIIEKPGSKIYGILSVLVQAFYNTEYLFTVNEKVFSPPPKVKSAVIRLTRNSRTHLGCNEDLFFRVVKTAFNQRRKTLRNSLKSLYPQPPIPDSQLPTPGSFFTSRPEQLSVDEFIDLTLEIQKSNLTA